MEFELAYRLRKCLIRRENRLDKLDAERTDGDFLLPDRSKDLKRSLYRMKYILLICVNVYTGVV